MECANLKVHVDSGSLRVRDVMLARPKTLSADATVGDLRRLFANAHVRTTILAEDGVFVGSLDHDQPEPSLPDAAPARDLMRRDADTIGHDATVAEAMRRLDELDRWRLIVIGDDGVRLEGLPCLNSSRAGFCR